MTTPGRYPKPAWGKTLAKNWLAATAALLVTGLLSTAPAAEADQNMYLNEIDQRIDTPLSIEQALQLGQVACNAIRQGINAGLSMGKARAQADEAVGQAQNSMGIGLNMAEGMFLVEAAEDQLC